MGGFDFLGPPEPGPFAEINLDQGTGRGLMTSGRCALNIDWGDMGTLPLDPTVSKVLNVVLVVMDAGLGASPTGLIRASLRPLCDTTQPCPNAVDGINHAPFNAFGGWIGAINAKADPKAQAAALDFIAYVSAPEQSNPDVTTGVTGEQPWWSPQERPRALGLGWLRRATHPEVFRRDNFRQPTSWKPQ